MTDQNDVMPYNPVGGSGDALLPEIDEEQWRAENLPAEKLTFRWRYTDKVIHLYERRLRSLADFNIGPAVRAWVRARLEWTRDNVLFEQPNGVLVLSIDPEGDVDIELEPYREPPIFDHNDLIWFDGALVASTLGRTLWVARDNELVCLPPLQRHAADRLVRDLASTLGYSLLDRVVTKEEFWDIEVFVTDDEFGVIPCADMCGDVVAKMQSCFEKLWASER